MVPLLPSSLLPITITFACSAGALLFFNLSLGLFDFFTGDVSSSSFLANRVNTECKSFFSTCFIYDFGLTRNVEGKKFPEFSHIKVGFSNKKDGKYKIEIFDIESGKKIEKEKEAKNGKIFVDIPSFKKWIAVKIIYNE